MGVDAVVCHHRLVDAAPAQDAAVDLGMQGLDPAVHHFRKAGVIGDFDDGDAVFGQQLGGAAGGEDFDAQAGKGAGEIDDAGFVGNADQGAGNFIVHDDARGLRRRMKKGITSLEAMLSLHCNIIAGRSGHFLAQGAAAEAQHLGGLALVVAAMFQDGLDQRALDFVEDHGIQVADLVSTIQPREIVLHRQAHMLAEDQGCSGRLALMRASNSTFIARSTFMQANSPGRLVFE